MNIIECLKCDKRFIDIETDKICMFCDNNNTKETIVCCPEMYEDCDCQECTDLKKKLNKLR